MKFLKSLNFHFCRIAGPAGSVEFPVFCRYGYDVKTWEPGAFGDVWLLIACNLCRFIGRCFWGDQRTGGSEKYASEWPARPFLQNPLFTGFYTKAGQPSLPTNFAIPTGLCHFSIQALTPLGTACTLLLSIWANFKSCQNKMPNAQAE